MGRIFLKKLNENLIVTQSNSLIEARYSLTLYEQRLVLMMISMVEPDDEDFKDYIIKVQDFNKLLGINHKGSYGKIKSILRELRAKELLINKGGQNYLITGWISDAEYVDDDGVVILSFSKKLKPYLLALKSDFTSKRLHTLINFKGIYTIRLYGLLKQYEKIGRREFKLLNLREILGIKENQYRLYADFKRRTIIAAQKEFNKRNEEGVFLSDINFTLEEEKVGRRINLLRFIINKQNNIAQKNLEAPKEEKKETPAIVEAFEALGIHRNIIYSYYEEDGQEALEKILFIFENDKRLGKIQKSEQGYLMTLLKNRAGTVSEAEKKAEEAKIQAEQEEQKRRYEEAKQKRISSLKKDYARTQRKLFLNSLSEEHKKDILEEVRYKYKDSPRSILSMINNLESPFTYDVIHKKMKKYAGYEEGEIAYIKENLNM